MSREKDLVRLETSIVAKINKIETGVLLPKDSGIGVSLNLMKKLDEPLYDSLLSRYKIVLAKIAK